MTTIELHTIKTAEEMEGMTDAELLEYRQGLKADMRKLHEKTVARQAEMKAVGLTSKVRAKDEEIIALKQLQTKTAVALQALADFRSNRAMEKKIEREANELALMRIEMEQSQLKFENRDVIAFRNAQADERRPGGPVVWIDPLYRNLHGAEKRLIIMMAREIGQARFAELKRIAFWDEHHRNNKYYSSTMFGGKE